MEVACFKQRRVHHPLDLLPQSDADLQHEDDDEDPGEEENGPEDDQGAQVLHVLGEHPPEHHGSHPGRDEDDGGQGEAADHVLVRSPLPQCVKCAPLKIDPVLVRLCRKGFSLSDVTSGLWLSQET